MVKARKNIEELQAYVPGEQPGYAETGRAGGIIKLNTNENPYPPAEGVLQAIRSVLPEALRLYPPAQAMPFRRMAASVHGLSPDHVIATNGGDELLRMLIAAYCSPGPGPYRTVDKSEQHSGVGLLSPSYSLYAVLAQIQDAVITVVDREPDSYGLPADVVRDVAAVWNRAGCALGFVVNPHAPSGALATVDTLHQLAQAFAGILVVDEAYVDFAEHDATALVRDMGRGNVILLRTLSKGYSLAGLRFGYGLAAPAIIATLDKVRDSYNTDIIGQLAATAALEHREVAMANAARVIAERARLSEKLRERGFRVYPSQTNFLLVVPPAPQGESGGGRSGDSGDGAGGRAEALYRGLKERKILVRYFGKPPMADKLRITVGTPEQDDIMLAAIDELLR